MTVSPAVRKLVAKQAKFRCCYCYSQQDIAGVRYTIDHIIPQSLGGSDEIGNLCLACSDCNRAKYDRITALDPISGETFPLFHPNNDDWHVHFQWRQKGC